MSFVLRFVAVELMRLGSGDIISTATEFQLTYNLLFVAQQSNRREAAAEVIEEEAVC